jgi:hypothetical protein
MALFDEITDGWDYVFQPATQFIGDPHFLAF